MKWLRKLAAFFSGEEPPYRCPGCGGGVGEAHRPQHGLAALICREHSPVIVSAVPAAPQPIRIDRTPLPHWPVRVYETADAETVEYGPFALTDQHAMALEIAIRAEGYDILVDPTTGAVHLTKAE